ncbi:hypothetical protein [Longimicrobium sp.]|uniref:hypothetical protein n=1 Tax=Longimicrobium sp. TaxID=2029185 RepID=UPI002BBE3A7D|nr:hypothetical protein [Longimicrobium sp.]HSU16724.1 hypothetical protein [Longimicrobium sp.]
MTDALTGPGAADGGLAELCIRAVTTAAHDLGLDPALFAEELAQGEIGLLIHYLARAAEHVPDVELREQAGALVHRLTDWTGSAEDG